jgi:hypothetical protein
MRFSNYHCPSYDVGGACAHHIGCGSPLLDSQQAADGVGLVHLGHGPALALLLLQDLLEALLLFVLGWRLAVEPAQKGMNSQSQSSALTCSHSAL